MLSRRIASRLRDMETPFYLYDTELLRQTLESVVNESKRYNYKVHYAIKANYDDRLLAIIREYGLGVDCASGNEVQKAIEAGFDPKSIVYAGVGKRDKRPNTEHRSYAQLTPDEKDAISHRGNALAVLEQQLPGFLSAAKEEGVVAQVSGKVEIRLK